MKEGGERGERNCRRKTYHVEEQSSRRFAKASKHAQYHEPRRNKNHIAIGWRVGQLEVNINTRAGLPVSIAGWRLGVRGGKKGKKVGRQAAWETKIINIIAGPAAAAQSRQNFRGGAH